MQIANPIYDVVFKYMMNDNKVAKLLLSAIIGEEIIELKFEPTELSVPLDASITVLRMDFKATVKYQNGEQKVIIIELQKAKLPSDIMRFRRYLGNQYSSENNAEIVESRTIAGLTFHRPYPILSIYFLGHSLNFITDVPVIKVARKYFDAATQEEITQKEEFIESLTHDSFIIQIPFIKGHRRTELEKLLHIFEQSSGEKINEKHILEIDEENIAERYRPVLRRLIRAIAEPKIREVMQAEDDIIDYIKQHARIAEEREKKIKKQSAEIKEQETEIKKQETEIKKQNIEIKNKEKQLENAILALLSLNQSDEMIAQTLNISVELVSKLRNKSA